MTICILTSYYHPEITALTHLLLDLSNDFVKYNAEVFVVTGYPSRGIDESERLKYLDLPEETSEGGVKIRRVGMKVPEGKSFILRTIRYLIISYALYKEAKRINPDVYLITSTPPFLGLLGAFLSKIAPTVYNLQDLFPDSLIYTGKMNQKNFIVRILKRTEQFIYKKNTHILTISEDLKNNITAKGVPLEKISVVYNWIDVNAVIPVKREENELIAMFNLKPDAFYVTYCGNIGHTQNLEMVVDVAKRLEPKFPDIIFVIIGDGAWVNNIIKYIKERNAANVLMLPYQPYEMISSVFSLGDVSLVCSKKGVSIGSVPSKTWSIMSAGRAVICSFDEDSELCSFIRDANCGICLPPEDNDAFEEAVIELYDNRLKTQQYGLNGREFVKENLAREASTLKYFIALQNVIV